MKLCFGVTAAIAALVSASPAEPLPGPRSPRDALSARDTPTGNGTIEISLILIPSNGGLIPTVNLSIGTPPQSFMAQIDTGSSYLWVPDLTSPLCTELNTSLCNNQSIFAPVYTGGINPSASSTYQELKNMSQFSIKYGSGDGVNGTFAMDTMTIGDASVPNVEFSLATSGVSPQLPLHAIWGVASQAGQNDSTNPGVSFPEPIAKMVSSGAIGCQMFSMWMNGEGEAPGSMLFGGIDEAKFEGNLSLLPMLTADQNDKYYTVPWTSVVIGSYASNGSSTKFDVNVPAIIDSGSAAVSLPPDMFMALGQALGITDPNVNFCDFASQQLYFSFEFNADTHIVVNGSDIIKPTATADGSPFCKSPFIQGAEGAGPILGVPFMQAVYAVHDLDNKILGLAQAKKNATDSNIVKCDSTSGVPGLGSWTVTNTASLPPATAAATVAMSDATVPTGTVASAEAPSPTLSFLSGGSTASATSGASASASSGAAVSSRQPPVMIASVVPAAMCLLSMLAGGVAFFL